MDQTPDIEREHSFDGIKEYDNPLPMWWLWTFFLTIIFSAIYYLHYEVAGGPTLKDELNVEMTAIEQAAQKKNAGPAETEESLAAFFANPKAAEAGSAIFAGKCAACHGDKLQGLIGPNLVDKFWIHGGGTRTDIVKVIREGVADKGMPPWGSMLKKDELLNVTAFIVSKKGSNPPGAKAAQGNEVPGYFDMK